MKQTFYILILLLLNCSNSFSQEYTEYYFKFNVQNKSELDTITQIISIDNVTGLEVFAYANQEELDKFQKLDYKIEFLQKDVPKSITMATTVAEMLSWNRYPTYSVYRQLLKNFESNYPSICKLDSIGTTKNGRKLYVLKISDNVNIEEDEPEFLYTSTIHGDETTGFILMLRLADSLLTSYGSEPEISNLVNEIEIYINPNANPDGTYYGGDNTVSSARRYNANGVDLNRDFPDPRTGPSAPYQVETQTMMDFAEEHNFVMSANFHGGAEVTNYPWDTWRSSQNPHTDTEWFEHICTDYVTTARTVLSSYMSNVVSDGVTEGGDWYVITGGRQDYMSYWHQCREVTMEVSATKLLAVESFNNFWNYNKESLLNYMNECLYGIRGKVKNDKGIPLDAMIWIVDHDSNGDSSMVFTDPDLGDYHRPIAPGTYDIVAISDGYKSDTAKNIVVTLDNTVWLNFELIAEDDSISLEINPISIYDTLFFDQNKTHDIVISNNYIAASTIYSIAIENEEENPWLTLNKYSGTLYGIENDTLEVSINSDLLIAGHFNSNIFLTSADSKTDTIPVFIVVKDTISTQIKPEVITDTLWAGENSEYEIVIENNGLISFNYSIHIEDEETHPWINLNKISGNLSITERDTVVATLTTQSFGFGNFNCNIIVEKENSTNDTIPIAIYVKDTVSMQIEPEFIIDGLWGGESSEYDLIIKNDGLISINYSIQVEDEASKGWVSLNKQSGNLSSSQIDTIKATIVTDHYGFGDFLCNIIIETEYFENDTIPVSITIKDTIDFTIEPAYINDSIFQDTIIEYPIVIKNIGHSTVVYSSDIEIPTKSYPWISLINEEGLIMPGTNDTIFAVVNTTSIEPGAYMFFLNIYEESGKGKFIPFDIFIKSVQSIQLIPEISELKLYPNPFSEQISIEFNTHEVSQINLRVYNVCGNILFENNMSTLNNEKISIVLNSILNIQNLQNGIYFFQISTSSYKLTKKIVKY